METWPPAEHPISRFLFIDSTLVITVHAQKKPEEDEGEEGKGNKRRRTSSRGRARGRKRSRRSESPKAPAERLENKRLLISGCSAR